jgi:transposase-like protein
MNDDNGAVASNKKTELKLPSQVDPTIAEQLVAQARDEGVDLVGPGGLLSELTKQVLETGLEVEMEEHLGYEKHAAEGRDGGNSRNGTRSKKVITEESAARMLAVEIDVPRDRDGSFEPKTVRKRQCRLHGVDSMREGPHNWRGSGAPGRGLWH